MKPQMDHGIYRQKEEFPNDGQAEVARVIRAAKRAWACASISRGGFFAISRAAIGKNRLAELLQRHIPVLRYDSQEPYFADAASEWTDNPGNQLATVMKPLTGWRAIGTSGIDNGGMWSCMPTLSKSSLIGGVDPPYSRLSSSKTFS